MSLHKSVRAVQINTIMTGNYIRKKRNPWKMFCLFQFGKLKKKKEYTME